MTELVGKLRDAFEEQGYEVSNVSQNRDKYRIDLLEERANAPELRTITEDSVGKDAVLGFDVTTESVDGADGVHTVVSFRHRG